MTKSITRPALTIDSFAAYLITDTIILARSNPAAFYATLDAHDDLDHFAELLIIDEFDCPDDIYTLFDIDDETPIAPIRDDARLLDMIRDALRFIIDQIPRPHNN